MTNLPRNMFRSLLITVVAVLIGFAGTGSAFAFDGGAGTGGQPVPVNPGNPPVAWTPQPDPCNGLLCGGIAGGGCGATGIGTDGLPLQCPEPAPTYTLVTRLCGWNVGADLAEVDGPAANISAIKHAQPKTLPPAPSGFAQGDHTLAACAASYYVNFNVNDKSFGLYKLVAAGTQKACSWKQWSDGRPLEFSSCGKETTLPSNEYRFTRACGYVNKTEWVDTVNGKPLHFDATDCGDNSPTPQWSCNLSPVQWYVPNAPTSTRPATVGSWVTVPSNRITTLAQGDDAASALGEDGFDRIRWTAPKISGLDNAVITSSRLAYLAGPQGKVPGTFLTTKPGLNAWQPGVVTTWDMSYWQATPGGVNLTHQLEAQWTGTGSLTTTVDSVTGYDMKSQSLTFAPTQVTVNTTFTCTADVAVQVDRGRNTN